MRESKRDQEEGGELDSHEEVRLSFAGPGEIKKREVVLDPQESPEEIKSREVVLDPQESPEEIKSREVEQGGGAELRKLDFFCFGCYSTAVLRTLSLWLCSTQQLKQQLRCTLVASHWRGPHCHNIIVLAVVHGLLGLPGRSALSSHSLVRHMSEVDGAVPLARLSV